MYVWQIWIIIIVIGIPISFLFSYFLYRLKDKNSQSNSFFHYFLISKMLFVCEVVLILYYLGLFYEQEIISFLKIIFKSINNYFWSEI